MKKSILFGIYLILILPEIAFSQSKEKLFLGIGYGAAYSFFVHYEQPPDQVPPGFLAFYNKNRIGSISSLNLGYCISPKNCLAITYSRQMHVGRKNFAANVAGARLFMIDFKLRHTNNFFELSYSRSLSKKGDFWASVGVYVLNPEQQEIDLFGNKITIEERNDKNSNLQEGGFVGGIKWRGKLSEHFFGGFEAKVYFTASIGTFETISITPILSYCF